MSSLGCHHCPQRSRTRSAGPLDTGVAIAVVRPETSRGRPRRPRRGGAAGGWMPRASPRGRLMGMGRHGSNSLCAQINPSNEVEGSGANMHVHATCMAELGCS